MSKSIIKTIRPIINHPINKGSKFKAILRFIKWQLGVRLNPYPVVYNFATKSRFVISKGLVGATGNIYCGLHEFEDMSFVLHALRASDTFIDIGANVGSYTILAGSEIGAKTFSIEPIPLTYSRLQDNIAINHMQDHVTAYNIGLGSEKGELAFTQNLDAINHVALEGEKDTVKVTVEKFDDIFKLDTISFIKIDAEGFETEVINGMDSALQNKFLKAIIIELNGLGSRYGYNDEDIHNKLIASGFTSYSYDPFKRELSIIEGYGTKNTLYIRDYEFINERIKSAPYIEIYNTKI